MGTILLRRATQIVNRVNREAAFEIEQQDEDYGYRRRKKKVVTLTATATVNIDGDPVERVNGLRGALVENRARMFRLMEIGTRIRQAMGVKQAECGVTALVTERVGVVRKQTVLEVLLGEVSQSVYNESEFQAQVEATQKRLSKAVQALVVAEMTTPLLSDGDRQGMRQELTGLKRRLLDIDDKLAELNATNSITLSDEDEAFLHHAGIA